MVSPGGSKDWGSWIVVASLVAVGWSVFQLYGAAFGLFNIMIQRPIHLVFALMLAYLSFPARKSAGRLGLLDYLPALGALLIGIYVVVHFERISTRMVLVDLVSGWDLFFGFLVIVLCLESCRRTTGMALPIISLLFIAFAFLGPYLPGTLRHAGMTLDHFVEVQFLSSQGLFSEPIGVSAEVVFYFVLFGAFLEKSGVGELFTDVANSVTGRARGGTAKASVVSSALFGTISGSAVANVVVDGVFTIPMMKKAGFRPDFAASVEAVASTGGQIMPPVMGAAAFLMADLTGVSYSMIIIHAAVPAILYYIAIYFMVDFEAWKLGMRPDSSFNMAALKKGLVQRLHLSIPIFILIYFIMTASLMRATLIALVAAFVVSQFRATTRMGLTKVVNAMAKGAREAIHVAVPSAVAGIMVGIIVYTGIGLKFTSFLVAVSGGNLLLGLFFTMIGCLILGMGMPTSAAYLIAAVLMAPALVNMGLPVIVAHMFVFYFAVISMITPPVALATYAAASIAESDIWKTGITGFMLALTAFLVPYAFAYNHALLFMGSYFEIVWVFITAAIGVCLLSMSVIGFFHVRITAPMRVLLFVAAILLITPEKITDFVGLAIGVIMFLYLRRKGMLERRQAAAY